MLIGKFFRGFTLIELLVVIAIISVLSSIVLAQLNEARAKARDASRIATLNQIAIMLQLYNENSGSFPLPPVGCTVGVARVLFSGSTVIGLPACEFSVLKGLLSAYGGNGIPNPPYGAGGNSNYPVGGGSWENSYGILYVTDSVGSKYDLITKLETDHPSRCAADESRNTWVVGLPAGGWFGHGQGIAPAPSLCQGDVDKRDYLYQGALTR